MIGVNSFHVVFNWFLYVFLVGFYRFIYRFSHRFSDFGLGLKAFAGEHKGTVYDHHKNLNMSQRQKQGRELAKINGCKLITTEKDFFRIKKAFRKNINFLKIELSIDQEKKFYKYIKERL